MVQIWYELSGTNFKRIAVYKVTSRGSTRKNLARAADTGNSNKHNAQESESFWMCKVRCWRWLFGNKIQISLVSSMRPPDRVARSHNLMVLSQMSEMNGSELLDSATLKGLNAWDGRSPLHHFISQNAFDIKFQKFNSPPKMSDHFLLLLIEIWS